MNEIRNNLLDYYLNPNAFIELHEKYQHNKIASILCKYSKDGSSINQIMEKIEMYRNTKNSMPEETIVERVKLVP